MGSSRRRLYSGLLLVSLAVFVVALSWGVVHTLY
eukprot:COSAG02_NODE_40614_length_403_cov_1.092105_1_plen_33_part_10